MDNMQLWLSSSTDSINLNDSAEGFYLNPDLEGLTGLPEIRSVNGLNAGYDGGWTATQLWAARLITIRGVIAINDKAAVETKRKALAKLLAQGKSEDLELKFVSEAGNTYTTTVRTTGCTMALQRVFWRQEYQIQLRANDPLIYDDGGSDLVAILRVMAGEGGFEIPFDIPFTIGGSIEPTSVDAGDEATYPLIRLKGDLHNPTIINMTTNQRMQVLADIITTVEWRDYATTYTTNGFVQISDGIDGAPTSLTHLYGNATQQTYSGKNLFNINATPTLGNIAELVVSGQSITISSNANATTARAELPVNYEANREMTISFDATCLTYEPTATNTSLVYLRSGSNTAGYKSIANTVGATTHYSTTFTPTVSGMNLWLYLKSSQVAGVVSFRFDNIQIEYGASETDYEQFVGGTPAPNPEFPQPVETVTGEQTVRIVGKNIAEILSLTNTNHGMTYTFNEDGTITLNGTTDATSSANASGYFRIRLKAGQTYTFSANNSDINANVTVRLERGNGKTGVFASGILNAANKTWSFVGDDTDCRMQIRIASGVTLNNFTFRPQLELGSTASEFEPYQSQSQTINLGSLELAKIGTYQDYIWNDDGTWKIHKEVGKVVFNGSEAGWQIVNTGYDGRFRIADSLPVDTRTSDIGAVISDNFTATSYGNIYNATIDYGVGLRQTTNGFAIRQKDCATVADFKTWLSTHNTTVYYALATPTDTEITDSELLEQLNHIYSLYQGTNNLWLIPSAGAQGEMEVSYATTEDIDYHEVVIDCQARTVTQDGRNLYPALAEGSEFIRLLPGENKLYLTSEVESDNGTAEVKFKKGNISI